VGVTSPRYPWRRLGWYAVTAVGGAALLLAVAYQVGGLDRSSHDYGWTWLAFAVTPLYALALFLVIRRPDHPEAHWLTLVASSLTVGSAVESVTWTALPAYGAGTWLVASYMAWSFATLVTTVAIAGLIGFYPDGVPERRWQGVLVRALWALLAFPLLLLLTDPELPVDPTGVTPGPSFANPFAVPGLEPFHQPLEVAYSWLGSFGYGFAGPLLLVLRHRRATAEQRRPMRLMLLTVVSGAILLVLDETSQALGLPGRQVFLVLYLPVLGMMAVSIAVGVLRHGLFDIELVVRRSVVYAVLSAGIIGLYAALAALPGLAFGRQIPVEVAVILTIAAALAFQPLRRRLDGLASRWVFGRRTDRYQVLTAFGATLERTVALERLLPRLATVVHDGLGAAWVRVSLRGEAAWLDDPVGIAGSPSGDVRLTQLLEHHGETVGRIECGPSDRSYTDPDRELLATLAGQAATAIANVRLTARLADQLTELRRSRARIVAAQDDERRRIERDIHDGVQQTVVALITKLALVRSRLGRGAVSAESVLGELQVDARELLTDLRELAHGIHPPVLSDRGLVAAVEARAGRLAVPVAVHADPSLRGRRLGTDAEGAAYYLICEALTNVMKHAGATETTVGLAAADGHLQILVSDNGTGFGDAGSGAGLTNLRDRVEALGGRLDVDTAPGHGTRVRAELPITTGSSDD